MINSLSDGDRANLDTILNTLEDEFEDKGKIVNFTVKIPGETRTLYFLPQSGEYALYEALCEVEGFKTKLDQLKTFKIVNDFTKLNCNGILIIFSQEKYLT